MPTNRLPGGWHNLEGLPAHEFTCGHCGRLVASDKGYYATPGSGIAAAVYVCPNCNRPSYIQGYIQIPGVSFGNPVESVPPDVDALYNEARRSAAGASTSAVMAARKLLMHIAVNKGAVPGQSFVQYVEYLSTKGFVPPDGKDWVDHIRDKGNEANHEIKIMQAQDAEELITFAEMLLKFIYEFPARVPPKKPVP